MNYHSTTDKNQKIHKIVEIFLNYFINHFNFVMVVFFDHENIKLGGKNHKFMLTFDRVIVILRKFFNVRRFFCLATKCSIFQCADKSIIFLPCICYLENISKIHPTWGEGGLYLAHGLNGKKAVQRPEQQMEMFQS